MNAFFRFPAVLGAWLLANVLMQVRLDAQTVATVDPQPFTAQVRRVMEATEALGAPLPAGDR
ncbi:MAG: hypothetical protein J0L84_19640, partial [Verrucomicrobia bacterium]|nr:hypothetical protein [Verrucomicrobiota bacterium]